MNIYILTTRKWITQIHMPLSVVPKHVQTLKANRRQPCFLERCYLRFCFIADNCNSYLSFFIAGKQCSISAALTQLTAQQTTSCTMRTWYMRISQMGTCVVAKTTLSQVVRIRIFQNVYCSPHYFAWCSVWKCVMSYVYKITVFRTIKIHFCVSTIYNFISTQD